MDICFFAHALLSIAAFLDMSIETWYGWSGAFSMGYNPTRNYWTHCPRTDPATARVQYGRQVGRSPLFIRST